MVGSFDITRWHVWVAQRDDTAAKPRAGVVQCRRAQVSGGSLWFAQPRPRRVDAYERFLHYVLGRGAIANERLDQPQQPRAVGAVEVGQCVIRRNARLPP